jgi:hypothetical protein
VSATLIRKPLDPAPRRPEHGIAPPAHRLVLEARIDTAHLANPVVAVSRLLASEADAHVHVSGDDDRMLIAVALPDSSERTVVHAEDWVRWALHNAGVRGCIRRASEHA